MRKHSKAILGGGAGILALAVVLSVATSRSEPEPEPATEAMTAPRAPAAASHPGAPGTIVSASLPPAVAAASQGETGDAEPAGVRRVDPQTVCMVNDRAMGKPQIPVEVDDKTYYGCCAMCKQRLAQDEAVRYATDPVTGQRVDKASAVIAERPDGSVLYFASAETFDRYGAARGGT